MAGAAGRGDGLSRDRTVLVFPPVGGAEGLCKRPGRWDHRGSAHLRLSGQRRCLERAGTVFAGPGGKAQSGGWSAAGLFFPPTGSCWGNPLYDWQAQKRDGFGWWIRRVEGASRLFDAIRIDHFRGLESYWAVPAGAATAREGHWEKGPGLDLLRVLVSWFPQITYIAEDLGLLTDAVHQLRAAAGLPGMKVLEFAFSGPDNAYLPHNHQPCCVCYTGTHDNDTAAGWYAGAAEEERAFAERYLGASGAQAVRRALLRCGQGSVAELFVAKPGLSGPWQPGADQRARCGPGQLALADAARQRRARLGRRDPASDLHLWPLRGGCLQSLLQRGIITFVCGKCF